MAYTFSRASRPNAANRVSVRAAEVSQPLGLSPSCAKCKKSVFYTTWLAIRQALAQAKSRDCNIFRLNTAAPRTTGLAFSLIPGLCCAQYLQVQHKMLKYPE